METAGTRWLRRALGRERKVLRLQRRVGFKADDVAAIAQMKERAFSGAYRAALQSILVELHRAEVFAVAAVLPLEFDGRFGLALEVDLTQQMASILTLDGTLARSEEPSFVFRTEYSHFSSSLQRRVTVQVVFGTQHVMTMGEIRT